MYQHGRFVNVRGYPSIYRWILCEPIREHSGKVRPRSKTGKVRLRSKIYSQDELDLSE